METSGRCVDTIPQAVRDLAARQGCTDGVPIHRVRLRQRGVMRQDGESKWMRFRARQTIETRRCGFDWRANTGPLRAVVVRDAFDGGGGDLTVKLFGCVPIASTPRSAELDQGELLRYLAELPWAPDAILLNPKLTWRVAGERELLVSASVGAMRAELRLKLNADGLIGEVAAAARPRAVGGKFVVAPWRGVFSGYADMGGRNVPRNAEVSWIGSDGVEPVWRGEVQSWRAADDR